MDKKSLRQLSKNELIKIIFDFKERFEKLERLLKSLDNPHTPSSKKRKKSTQRDKEKTRFPGKPPGSGGGGIKLPPPDEIQEHTLENCPDCQTPLGESKKVIKKTVIDFPKKLTNTVEHHIYSYNCSCCKKNILAREVPKHTYGVGVQAVITQLKDNNVSCQRVSSLLRSWGFPTISAPFTLTAVERFAHLLKRTAAVFLGQIRNAPYLHADETGFRKDGKNGYVWGIFTKSHAYFSAQLSRGRKCIEKLLGKYKGVVVVDGYGAYLVFPNRQRCWAHLLREAKDYTQKNDDIKIQYQRLKVLFQELKVLNTKPPDEQIIQLKREELKDVIVCLDAIKVGRKLATYIKNGADNWFTALYHKDVPLTNNHAERGLRKIVLQRKTMGCYRTKKGENWINIIQSVFSTWRLQGKNIHKELLRIAQRT